MPVYLDHHKVVPDKKGIEAARMAIKSGKADPKTGIKAMQGFVGKSESWCLNEAPNAQSVHKLHESMGINLGPGDVTEVTTVA